MQEWLVIPMPKLYECHRRVEVPCEMRGHSWRLHAAGHTGPSTGRNFLTVWTKKVLAAGFNHRTDASKDLVIVCLQHDPQHRFRV